MNSQLPRIIVTGLLLGGMPSLLKGADAGQQKPVNLIQILTDDQGWGDLACYGHKQIKSPHLDRLASEGIRFTSCYSADAVCSPSRAAILTGRTPFRNGVYRWVPADHFCYLPAGELTLPQVLRKGGYQTAHLGKWHLSHYGEKRGKGPEDYSEFVFSGNPEQPNMEEYGYDYWFATGNVARPNHENPQNFFLNGKPTGTIQGFSAQIVANQFEVWMNEVRNEDRPFFMTIWLHEPHGPVNSDPKFLAQYPDIDDPSLKQYLANITQIDAAVGTIVQSLKNADIYEDTLIWYTSDNGPEGSGTPSKKPDSPYGSSRYRGSAGDLRGRKRHTHEGGIRVPGILSWPAGFKRGGVAGTVNDTPIIGSDVFPTCVELAGLTLPAELTLDSASIIPLFHGEKLNRKQPLYWRNNKYQMQVALRDGDWKLLSNSKRTEFELYNLRKDRAETANLVTQEPERFALMKKALVAYDKDVLKEGPKWWQQEKRMKATIPLD